MTKTNKFLIKIKFNLIKKIKANSFTTNKFINSVLENTGFSRIVAKLNC